MPSTERTVTPPPELPEDTWVDLHGTVAAVDRVWTQKGAILLRGTMTHRGEPLRFIVFPKGVPELEHVLRPGACVWVRGRIERDDSGRPDLLVARARRAPRPPA